ncbi:GNAT family N-acetyltransferase [Tellurirhabdus rosea]|uniref:GNAT family N-acetyltransferase n=1 Tax=Tellurirhabdus rosea TaxID=2674997 RepID=UPI00225903E3|nr:GNAT family N-acetyltransferase [Tellurirhabdus rosea]
MNVRYLRRHRIDSARWDACVAGSVQRLFYAYSWYLDAVAPEWCGLVVEEQGEYRAVMPVPLRRAYGIAYVRQPDFCPQLGIFSLPGVAVEALFLPFLSKLKSRFGRVMSYRFNEHNETTVRFPSDLKRRVRENHVLPLNRPYQMLRQQFATDRKTNLNRARNTGWALAASTDMRALIALHRSHNEAGATQQYARLDLTLYDRLVRAVDELQKRGMADLWFAELDGQREAGCLFVRDGGRIVYLFNGASPVGRRKQGRLWLLNRVFGEFAGQDAEFDFESPPEGAETVQAYYGSFGGETRPYSEVRWERGAWAVGRLLARLRRS